MPKMSYLKVVKLIAFLCLSLVAFFTVQPLISSQQTPPATPRCNKTMSCHPKKHSKQANGKCATDSCNPFMACTYCNFYLAEKYGFTFLFIAPEKEKKIAFNDNRLSASFSESWHPPEGASLYFS